MGACNAYQGIFPDLATDYENQKEGSSLTLTNYTTPDEYGLPGPGNVEGWSFDTELGVFPREGLTFITHFTGGDENSRIFHVIV